MACHDRAVRSRLQPRSSKRQDSEEETPAPCPDDLVLVAFEKASMQERAILALAATMGLRRNEIATLKLTARSDRELTVVGQGPERARPGLG